MKLLCFLPGCANFEHESLRRVYVWLMVPLLGMILLGVESGMTVSMATHLFGSFFSAFIALLPHGIIEILTLAVAGAVPYSAHLLLKRVGPEERIHGIFQKLKDHRGAMPTAKIALLVAGGLLVAGLIEAHVTRRIMETMVG